MLLLANILIVLLLLMIFVQDIKSRAVYWILFPLLALAFLLWQSIKQHSLSIPGYDTVVNLSFLLLQLLALSAWFSIKQKKLMNITNHLLGWGDILFLATLAFYFSVLSFFAFYIISLVGILLIWIVGKKNLFRNSPHIPLAGLQALLFLIVFSINSLMPATGLNTDRWILHIIS